MKKTHLSLTLLVASGMIGKSIFLASLAAFAQTGSSVEIRLESTNQPTRYISHKSSEANLEHTDSASGELDSIFIVRSGLASHSCFSFEAKNKPDLFLRHQNFRMVLSANDNSALFEESATFCPKPGLISRSFPLGVSLESYALPGFYIRHRDLSLWLDPTTGTQSFKEDASFYNISQSTKESAWEVYWKACGERLLSREEFTRNWRPAFELSWFRMGIRPLACG